jgi:replicative DNA helicase
MKPEALVDVEAEKALLGCCFLEGKLPEAARVLRLEDFGDARHAAVFAAMGALHASGVAVDSLTVAERLRELGTLGQAGGVAYLTQLDAAVHLSGNLRAYVATVRDRAMRRAVAARAQALLEEAHNLRRPPGRVAHEAGEDFRGLALSGGEEADERGHLDVESLNESWEAFAAGQRSPYLPSGLEALDAVFRGFVPNLNLVGGKASMGKTAFVAEVAWGWLQRGVPGGIFGLEDGTRWLVERHCARAVGLDLGDVGACRLHDVQQEAYQRFMGEAWDVTSRLLRVHRTSGLAAPELLRKAERWIAGGARWLVVDHGGRIAHESSSAKERYDLAIKRTAEGLDNLAHNTGVPIIVNWHFNREGSKQEGQRPTMEAFKESGYLEAFSGTMLGLWERPENEGHLLVTVVKNRKGPRDVTVALERDARYGLVKSTGGFALDFKAESAAAQAAKAARSRNKRNLFEPDEGTQLRALGGILP